VIHQHFIQQALTDAPNPKTNCLLKWKKQNWDLVLVTLQKWNLCYHIANWILY
jgi:hypothetical protein